MVSIFKLIILLLAKTLFISIIPGLDNTGQGGLQA